MGDTKDHAGHNTECAIRRVSANGLHMRTVGCALRSPRESQRGISRMRGSECPGRHDSRSVSWGSQLTEAACDSREGIGPGWRGEPNGYSPNFGRKINIDREMDSESTHISPDMGKKGRLLYMPPLLSPSSNKTFGELSMIMGVPSADMYTTSPKLPVRTIDNHQQRVHQVPTIFSSPFRER